MKSTNLSIVAKVTGGLYLTHAEVNELIDFYRTKAADSERKMTRYREIQDHLARLASGKITEEARNGVPAPRVKIMERKPFQIKEKGTKISFEMAMEVRERYKNGESKKFLCTSYGVSFTTIDNILRVAGRYKKLLPGEHSLAGNRGRPLSSPLDKKYELLLEEKYGEAATQQPHPLFQKES